MHYSAKRGFAIVCRPSVRLSGWKSWKLIARTISPTPSLFVAQRPLTYPRETWGNFLEELMTSPTIHEKINLGIIIVWSSKFPPRKKHYTQANSFTPINMGHIALSSLR